MRIRIALITVALVLAWPGSAFASSADARPLTATSILAGRAALDGTMVAFEGEAIGEMLHTSDDSVWLSVLSDGTALGVYLPEQLAEQIAMFGDYDTTGDTVRVAGEFRRACDEHGGDMDVHAVSLEVIAPGADREHPVEFWKLGLAAVAFGVAAAGTFYSRRRRLVVEGG
ncbi:MAG: hypothetical protein CVT59_10420 [Actinobacteria bacterium HGW-Actinobacteria-1]|jgi:hypothetical protein|nr:MAG: hypothetical protein CVT59_10420 [Actinobacteria bacterium HGW-Actinobacteria-1]